MATRITLVEFDGAGGLAHFAYQMANALADAGAEVTLVTSRHYELAQLPHRCRVDASLAVWPNIDVPSSGQRPLSGVRRRARRLWRGVTLTAVWIRLTRRLLVERPDVVQFSVIRFPFLAFFLRALDRSGLIVTQVCHEYLRRENGPAGRYLATLGGKHVYSRFALIFCLGSRIRDGLVETYHVPRERTRVIPMGDGGLFQRVDAGSADLRGRYHLGSDDRVVLFFGGLRPSKGVEDLIAAFAGVVHSRPNARLLIVGVPQAGVRPEAYEEQARALGIGKAVTVDPRYVPLEEVGALMRTVHVVALPYRTGTASAILQLAYAFGKPVVVTDVGAIAEPVTQERTGIVVPPADPEAITHALLQLLNEPGMAETMGMEGHQTAARAHAWPEIARMVLTSTQQIIAARAPRSTAEPADAR